MTDTIALREKIKESGYKLVFIANKIGLTYQGFLKKLNNDSEFKANEIQGLCDLLRIDTGEKEAIFFCTECRLFIYTRKESSMNRTFSARRGGARSRKEHMA